MIRLATVSHFDFIYEMYMHPAINPWLLYEQMDAQRFTPVFEELINKRQLYLYKQEEVLIGMCKLVPQQYRNAHILYIGGIAIHPAFTGNGHGLQLMNQIKLFAEAEGYKRLELSVATINEKAIHTYERAGFLKEGVMKNYTFLSAENRFLDEQLMRFLL
jgi:RimJ/RimL family protein N-acetyltransferase